ncbi:hypothetical protein OF83DRAFT_1178301, partial [Amylostereum chailletii]
NIRLVEKDQSHELAIAAERDGKAAFYLADKRCCENGLVRIPDSVPLNGDVVYPILAHAADFFWHLRRTSSKAGLASRVTIEAWQLAEHDLPDNFIDDPVLAPIGENLNVAGVIEIPVEDGVDAPQYGFKITSVHPKPLYVWLFAFNMSQLSVDTVYKPTIAGDHDKPADPPLPAAPSPDHPSELHIGYGSGGAEPQEFELPPGAGVDVTYLKLFITTRYVDLSYLEQRSPFPATRWAKSAPPRGSRELWDTLLVPMVQRRKKKPTT